MDDNNPFSSRLIFDRQRQRVQVAQADFDQTLAFAKIERYLAVVVETHRVTWDHFLVTGPTPEVVILKADALIARFDDPEAGYVETLFDLSTRERYRYKIARAITVTLQKPVRVRRAVAPQPD